MDIDFLDNEPDGTVLVSYLNAYVVVRPGENVEDAVQRLSKIREVV